MKIAEKNHSRLVLAEHPLLTAGLLVFSTLVLVYMLVDQWQEMGWPERSVVMAILCALPVITHFSIHWVDVYFSRALGRIEIRRRGLFYNQKRAYRLALFERARIDTNSSGDGGDTHRVVLIFDDAMVGEMPPDLRQEVEKQTRRGFRQTPPHEVPLTYYYTGGGNAEEMVAAINAWTARR